MNVKTNILGIYICVHNFCTFVLFISYMAVMHGFVHRYMNIYLYICIYICYKWVFNTWWDAFQFVCILHDWWKYWCKWLTKRILDCFTNDCQKSNSWITWNCNICNIIDSIQNTWLLNARYWTDKELINRWLLSLLNLNLWLHINKL